MTKAETRAFEQSTEILSLGNHNRQIEAVLAKLEPEAKELRSERDTLQARVQELETRNEGLEQEVTALKSRLGSQSKDAQSERTKKFLSKSR